MNVNTSSGKVLSASDLMEAKEEEKLSTIAEDTSKDELKKIDTVTDKPIKTETSINISKGEDTGLDTEAKEVSKKEETKKSTRRRRTVTAGKKTGKTRKRLVIRSKAKASDE